jgi:hypothetical protein
LRYNEREINETTKGEYMVKIIDLHLTDDRFNPRIQATVPGAWEATIQDSFGNLHHDVPVAYCYESEETAKKAAQEIALQYDFE